MYSKCLRLFREFSLRSGPQVRVLQYFSIECIYSPDAYRGYAHAFLKDLEAARSSAIIDIIHSGEAFEVKDEIRTTQKAQRTYISPLLSP